MEAEETLASRTLGPGSAKRPGRLGAAYLVLHTSVISSGLSVGWGLECHTVSSAPCSWVTWTRAASPTEPKAKRYPSTPTSWGAWKDECMTSP